MRRKQHKREIYIYLKKKKPACFHPPPTAPPCPLPCLTRVRLYWSGDPLPVITHRPPPTTRPRSSPKGARSREQSHFKPDDWMHQSVPLVCPPTSPPLSPPLSPPPPTPTTRFRCCSGIYWRFVLLAFFLARGCCLGVIHSTPPPFHHPTPSSLGLLLRRV